MRLTQVPRESDRKAFFERALAVYQQHKEQLETTARGKIVAIDIESGEVFIARTALEAAMKARKKFPDRLFYFVRVGYPAVHSLKGTGKRASVPERA